MNTKRQRILLVALIACLICFLPVAVAKKPGSGGGGVIYFEYEGDYFTMLDDGSQLTRLGPSHDFDGLPSRNLHAGKRWFLHRTYGSMNQLTVVSDAGDVATLALQSGLEIVGFQKWGIDDAVISIEAVQRDDDPDSASCGEILESGLYLVYYATDGVGNLIDASLPALLAFEVPAVEYQSGVWLPDLQAHDWAPDGLHFVFNSIDEQALYIGDIAAGQSQLLFDASTERWVYYGLWSPAGDRILFNFGPAGSHPKVMLIDPDGSNLQQLARGAPGWTKTAAGWSPTGSHLLLFRGDHHFQDSYILRMTADGTQSARLTGKDMGRGHGPRVLAWRN